MINKIWSYQNRLTDVNIIKNFSKKYNLPPIIATVLYNRGITKEKDIHAFFNKGLDTIINPMELTDMEQAADIISSAISSKEKIVIYGDYDVDGITSTVILYSFLKNEGADVEYYIPDRITEGYGINIMAINTLARKGAKLIITVDCGITAVGEVEFAKTQNLKMIITDHHTCKDIIPRAEAVINPKREDCEYPFKALCGAGVAFKLCLALSMKRGKNTRETFFKYCHLAAIGTVADVVSLLGENRSIVSHGLDNLSKASSPGIQALLELAGQSDKPVDSFTIAFAIAPRLNAAGRMGSADTAVNLLLSSSKEEAIKYAQALDELNTTRRREEQKIYDEAIKKIEKCENFDEKKVIVLSGENWHHGVIGIVASRILEKYYKPCILISIENNCAKGSARSIPGFNLFDALNSVAEHLVTFGGHSQAAGLSLDSDKIEDFDIAINKYAASLLTNKDIVPELYIECPVTSRMINIECAKQLKQLEPFGEDNQRPVFSLSNMKILTIGAMGQENRHLRIKVSDGGNDIMCVGFNMGEYASCLKQGDFIDIAFTIDLNTYMGRESVQLILKDIKKRN